MNEVVCKARRNSENRFSQYQPWDQLPGRQSMDAKKTMEKELTNLQEEELSQTTSEERALERTETVMGTSELYDKHGKQRFVPTPTPDPRDPLNLPTWRKVAALAALCFCKSDLIWVIDASRPC